MNTIETIFPFLELAAAASSGLLAGALLTEANVLVPYWRQMDPKDFLGLHHKMGPSLFKFFAPLTIAGTMLPLITLVVGLLVNTPTTTWWGISAAIGLVMLGIYFAYFKAANERFSTGSIQAAELPAELARWAYIHHIRTVLAVAGAFSSLVAVSL